jgi:hypothetical protein
MNIKTIAPTASPYKGWYLWPPRPRLVLNPDKLQQYDNGEYLAQPKLNGSNMVVFMHDDGTVKIMNRHNVVLDRVTINCSSLYRGKGWMVLNGEWMEKSKKDGNGHNFNGNFIIFDILAYDGFVLTGSTVTSRIILLKDLYSTSGMEVNAGGISNAPEYLYTTGTPNVYRVKTFDRKFTTLYNKLVKIDMYEGLVLKHKQIPLSSFSSQTNNGDWGIKVRKETRIYYH